MPNVQAIYCWTAAGRRIVAKYYRGRGSGTRPRSKLKLFKKTKNAAVARASPM